jgi:error-prone DNA polymerase
VPIFQEQVMQIAMIAADFSAGEADQLRRAMAAWKRKGGLDPFRQRLIGRMVDKGYAPDFAQRIFSQIEGFGEYGFPESHAASFAKLVYVSCWLKRHEPACFLAALLNSQPLGFYSPSQLVQDARRHQVQVRPVDVTLSRWDCTLESAVPGLAAASGLEQPAVRLGLRLVAQLSEAAAQRIEQARRLAPFASVEDLARRAELGRRDLDALAAADALAPLAGPRRQQTWAALALQRPPPLLRQAPVHEPTLVLAPMPEGQDIASDYRALGLSLRRHPLALLRARLAQRGLLAARELDALPGGRRLAACGIVTVRQQPSTAKGVMFVTLEDETGSVNVIVGRALRERQRRDLLDSRLLAVWGLWQREGEPEGSAGHGPVRNLVARRLQDLSGWLGKLSVDSRDFH